MARGCYVVPSPWCRQLSCCSFCRCLTHNALMFPPKPGSHTHHKCLEPRPLSKESLRRACGPRTLASTDERARMRGTAMKRTLRM
jgi:hypothetical protein